MERRIFLVAIQCLIFVALYFSTSSIAAYRGIQTPWLVTGIDQKIPFMPMFVWVYATAYILDTVGICLAIWKTEDQFFRRVLLACYANLILFSVFHLLYPHMAIKPAIDFVSVSGNAMVVIQSLTTKYNTFPSGHVSYSAITAWAAFVSWRKHPAISFVLILDALAIIASTVLIKEHTVLDVAGGLVVAITSIIIARCIYK